MIDVAKTSKTKTVSYNSRTVTTLHTHPHTSSTEVCCHRATCRQESWTGRSLRSISTPEMFQTKTSDGNGITNTWHSFVNVLIRSSSFSLSLSPSLPHLFPLPRSPSPSPLPRHLLSLSPSFSRPFSPGSIWCHGTRHSTCWRCRASSTLP